MDVQPPVNGTQAFVPQLGHNILERAQPQTQRPLEELLTALRKVASCFDNSRAMAEAKNSLRHPGDGFSTKLWI